VWTALLRVFTYLFPYLSYRSSGRAQLLTQLLPSHLPQQAIGGYAMWGGALIVVLGALCVGSEYGWGTLRTMLSIRPARLTVYAAQLATLATALAALVVVAFALSGAVSTVIAQSAGATVAAPDWGELARSMASGWLILCMWCSFGVVLAVLLRGLALSIGLGLVWILAIENLIRGTASLVDVLGRVETGLPGVNAGSLVAALGSAPGGGGFTGVAAIVSGSQALWVVLLYLFVFGGVGAFVLWRRDVQ
jgi:ABC-2 type transport system permease protein